MCRLFGFRSVINSQVHSSLLGAENSLRAQSAKHPDGWGLAYYLDNAPHLVKSSDTALNNSLFKKVSGIVSSQAVMAHIRKATQGAHSILNSHPFQYGSWIFAHNGNIHNFDSLRSDLLEQVPQDLSRFILGNTDSEVFFYILLAQIQKIAPLSQKKIPIERLKEAVETALLSITKITGPLVNRGTPLPDENYLSFLLTNGETFIGFQGGQPLNFCAHKSRCPERDVCPSFAPACEAPPTEGKQVNHLILASEPLEGVNIWKALEPGELVGVDHAMTFFRGSLAVPFVP